MVAAGYCGGYGWWPVIEYDNFLRSKLITTMPSGFKIDRDELPNKLYCYQKDLVQWACMRGKSALFTMTGTGKTAMQVSWADAVHRFTGGNVLILAPLAVAKQTVHEAAKFGINVHYTRSADDIQSGINITNYEILHHFDWCQWSGIALDESSILKNYAGKLRNYIIDYAQHIPYRLACTATPAPNDFMEIGNHAEFLGIMSHTEMLATFFVHDGGETSKWRLKGHAEVKFWEWLASWGVFLTKPSDLGYSDEGFDLPGLHTHQHIVQSEAPEGALFAFEVKGLQERQAARRESMDRRVERCVDIVNSSPKPFLVWCDLNAGSEMLTKSIPGAVEIKGSDSPEHKEKTMLAFAVGQVPVLVSKPSICGFGMNFQVCSNTAFVGLSDSFEAIFQATKRFHRHGQVNDVHRHIIISEAEGSVLRNILRKEQDFMTMIGSMVEHTKLMSMDNIKHLHSEKIEYKATAAPVFPAWLKGE